MRGEELKLTLKDRIILANQYAILEKLYPEEAEGYGQMREIVERGYELHYTDLNISVFESGLSNEDCQEVMSILDMYRDLDRAFKELEDRRDIQKQDIEFPGFDGNDRWDRLGYARFLILKQGRWEEVLEGRPHFDLNSHGLGRMDMYRRMLEVWEPIKYKRPFTYEDIKTVLNARIHPENRR